MTSSSSLQSTLDAARSYILFGKPEDAERELAQLDAGLPEVRVECAWVKTLSFAEPGAVARLLPSEREMAGIADISVIRRLTLLGVLANRSGEPDQAISYLNDARQLADEIGDMHSKIDVLLEFARVFTWTGRDSDAYPLLTEATTEVAMLDDNARMFLVFLRVGDLHLELNRPDKALKYFERSRSIEADHVGGVFWLRLHLDQARAELGAGSYQAALDRVEAFLVDHGADCPPYLSFLAHRTLTLAQIRLQRFDHADTALEVLRRQTVASGGDYENNEAHLVEAELMIAKGLHLEAETILRTMLPKYEVPDNAIPAIRIRLMLAQAYAGLDQRSNSTRVLTRGIEYAGMRDLKTQVQELRTTQARLGLTDTVPEESDRHFAEAGERGSGAYILLERVGSGGFGTVYRALDIERDREVAIKRFRLANLYSREQRESIIASIKNELDATAELSHPGIARTIACGREDGGEYYVVQEFIKGPSLRFLMDGPPIEVDWALAMARDVALALEALHAVGVRHRDIKPDNILMRNGRYPVLVDFGIATKESVQLEANIAGTRAYMPPELLAGYSDRGRGDIYGTAVVLLEVLGGPLPPDAASASLWSAWRRQKILLRFIADLDLPTDLPANRIKALLARAISYPLLRGVMSTAEFAAGLSDILSAQTEPGRDDT